MVSGKKVINSLILNTPEDSKKEKDLIREANRLAKREKRKQKKLNKKNWNWW